MATKKIAKVPEKMTAIVRATWGKGKKAVICDIPVELDFKSIWQSPNDKRDRNDVIDEVFSTMDREGPNKRKIINSKELVKTFKAWKKAEGR